MRNQRRENTVRWRRRLPVNRSRAAAARTPALRPRTTQSAGFTPAAPCVPARPVPAQQRARPGADGESAEAGEAGDATTLSAFALRQHHADADGARTRSEGDTRRGARGRAALFRCPRPPPPPDVLGHSARAPESHVSGDGPPRGEISEHCPPRVFATGWQRGRSEGASRLRRAHVRGAGPGLGAGRDRRAPCAVLAVCPSVHAAAVRRETCRSSPSRSSGTGSPRSPRTSPATSGRRPPA